MGFGAELGKVSFWLALCNDARVRFLRFRDDRQRDGLNRPGRRASLIALVLGASVAVFFFACSEQPMAADGYYYGDADVSDGDHNVGNTSSGGGAAIPPPEQELEETFVAPVVSGETLWSANPDTNKIARIFASTLEIEVLQGGHAPTYLAPLPSGVTKGGALVLNARSHDASIFIEDEDGSTFEHRVAVQEGASAWTVGSKGAFAIAWSRAADALLDPLDGYQDLVVLSINDSSVQTTALSVGFRPSRAFINEDESRAYIVSGPGISVISLGANVEILREIFLPEELPGQSRDVVFTLDGSLALVRVNQSNEILLIETESGQQKSLLLPGAATDLDISGDGSTAVAVVRGVASQAENGQGGMGGQESTSDQESLIALLPTSTIFEHPDEFLTVTTAEVVGSAVVASDASRVLLFTNAEPNARLSILDTESLQMRVVDMKAPVQAAFISQDANYAATIMSAAVGSDKVGAFGLIPLAEALTPRIEGTETRPNFVSWADDPARAIITTEASPTKNASTYFARLPHLTVDRIELPSAPLSAGVVNDAGRAFVSQAHPEGRITFIDLDDGSEQTLTGFELNSKVVD